MATYWLLVALRPLATYLPVALLAWVATIAGYLGFLLAPAARGAVLRNLAVAARGLPPHHRRRLAAQVFVHGALAYVELLGMRRFTHAQITARYQLDGMEHLDAAVRAGRGVIMISGHIGPMSVAGQVLAGRGVPMTVVVEPLHPPARYRLLTELRAAFGLRLLPLGPTTLREVVAALRRGELVGLAVDRDIAGSGASYPFFARVTQVTTAPATLARRTGAAVLPCVAYRTGLWRGFARIDPAIEIPCTDDAARDVKEGTRRIIACLEAYIAVHPEQWVVFSDLWPVAQSAAPGPRVRSGD